MKRHTRSRKLWKFVLLAAKRIGYSVMSMQGDEVSELAINDPSGSAVGVFAFDTKNGLVCVQGMKAIADTNTEAVKQDGDATVVLVVSLEPEAQH